jgi:hypothetical protein
MRPSSISASRLALVPSTISTQVRLAATQVGQCACEQRHRAHDHADGEMAAVPLRDREHFGMQVFEVAVDETRIARDAAAEVVRDEPLRLPLEQRHAEDVLDLAQHLGGAGLRDRDFFGGLVQRTVVFERDQQLQLLQAKARCDVRERGNGQRLHGNDQTESGDYSPVRARHDPEDR